MTAVRARLLQAFGVSLLMAFVAGYLGGDPMLAIVCIGLVNVIVLADLIGVATIDVGTDGLSVRFLGEEEEEEEENDD